MPPSIYGSTIWILKYHKRTSYTHPDLFTTFNFSISINSTLALLQRSNKKYDLVMGSESTLIKSWRIPLKHSWRRMYSSLIRNYSNSVPGLILFGIKKSLRCIYTEIYTTAIQSICNIPQDVHIIITQSANYFIRIEKERKLCIITKSI